MNYRFYRNALIRVAILSICVCGILYDALTGHKVGDPAALWLMAALVVGGNGWLTYMMLQAKKREQAQALLPRTAVTQPQQTVQQMPVEKSYAPSQAIRARQKQRNAMSIYALVVGFALIGFGLAGWRLDLIPAQYIGVVILVFGGLGFTNVNVWRGGPLDRDKDPRD